LFGGMMNLSGWIFVSDDFHIILKAGLPTRRKNCRLPNAAGVFRSSISARNQRFRVNAEILANADSFTYCPERFII